MRPRLLLLLLLATAPLGLGCAVLFSRSDPSSFYVLSESTERDAREPVPVALGVGPVLLPSYLDRPQIATRSGTNAISYSETQRWATPLQKNVVGVLTVNLARQLHTDRITSFPFALGLPRDYDANVQFLNFESADTGVVTVHAYYRIVDGRTGEEIRARGVTFTRSAPPGDYAAAAAALSDALGELSVEIAEQVRQIYAARPG